MQDTNDVARVDIWLSEQLPDLAVLGDSCPWVQNWANIGKISSKEIASRTNVAGWITTSKMQMGIDLPDVTFIILLRPPAELEDWLQSYGRGGRMMIDGKVMRVVCVCLWNKDDFADNVPGMTPEVQDFCLNPEGACLRDKLKAVYPGSASVIDSWCCSVCGVPSAAPSP